MRKFQRFGSAAPASRYIRIGGGHELRALPKVIGIKTTGDPLPDYLPNGLSPNDTSEGDFPDGFGYGYLNGISECFVYAANAVHVYNALLGDPVGWTYPVVNIIRLPDLTEYTTPGAGNYYTIYQIGVL